MTTAVLAIIHAGPQVTVQDSGRPGFLRFGVPASGPMDRIAYRIANAALGNPQGTPAIEVSLGGLDLECRLGPVGFAVVGGGFQVAINATTFGSWSIATLNTGDRLTIRPGPWGRWCTLAFAGRLQAASWLGSAATHAASGFGGGPLISGASLIVDAAESRADLPVAIGCPVWARPRGVVRVVPGPQERCFAPQALEALLTSRFRLTDAYDRMGVRLAGPSLRPTATLDLPSEPIVRGSVQVAGDGVATVLLADHQTTGGYPKIATILDQDLDGFVQTRSHQSVAFQAVAPAAAIAALRTRHLMQARYLDWVRNPDRRAVARAETAKWVPDDPAGEGKG